jgi:hypothetical protein
MTDLRNSDVGVGFLERLLALSERNPDRSRAASAAPAVARGRGGVGPEEVVAAISA